MNSISREMDNVSRLFMSSSDDGNKTENSQSLIKESPLINSEEGVEIEEKVSIQKKFAYPDNPDFQNKIMIRLQTLVREGYNIRRIELKKNTIINGPGRIDTKDEEFILYVKKTETE